MGTWKVMQNVSYIFLLPLFFLLIRDPDVEAAGCAGCSDIPLRTFQLLLGGSKNVPGPDGICSPSPAGHADGRSPQGILIRCLKHFNWPLSTLSSLPQTVYENGRRLEVCKGKPMPKYRPMGAGRGCRWALSFLER